MKRRHLLGTLAVACLPLASCGGGGGGGSPDNGNTRTLTGLAIAPAPAYAGAGIADRQLRATGTYSDGSTEDLTASVQWTSGNTAIATVSAAGIARGVAPGTTTVAASMGGVNAAALLEVTRNRWVPAGSLARGRSDHTATTLRDGTVLIIGGNQVQLALKEAEVFDPATGRSAAVQPTASFRIRHTATLLADGRVLVAGGVDSNGGPIATAEIFDPRTGAWSNVAPMAAPRSAHTATLLRDGRVLVLGRSGTQVTEVAEAYDGTANTWTPAGAAVVPRSGHTATLLADGKVLVVGGMDPNGGLPVNRVEVFDPATNAWSLAAPAPTARTGHSATLLADGTVLVAGGSSVPDVPPVLLASADIYDPVANTWTATGAMNGRRWQHSALLLPGGRVLVAGGRSPASLLEPVAEGEVYDPATRSWTRTAPMQLPRQSAAFARLADGSALVLGGGSAQPTASVEAYW